MGKSIAGQVTASTEPGTARSARKGLRVPFQMQPGRLCAEEPRGTTTPVLKGSLSLSTVLHIDQGLAKFSVKDWIVNIAGFMGQSVVPQAVQLCPGSTVRLPEKVCCDAVVEPQ